MVRNAQLGHPDNLNADLVVNPWGENIFKKIKYVFKNQFRLMWVHKD